LLRIFLDANVLFSAALRPRDREYAFFRIAREGGCTLLASAYALGEARSNLGSKAPHALPRLEGLAPLLEIVLDPPAEVMALAAAAGLPAKDAPILAAAIASAYSYLESLRKDGEPLPASDAATSPITERISVKTQPA
jgi:predicted nucleic acid-binding protein